MRERARHLLTPGATALVAAALFALPAALASDGASTTRRARAVTAATTGAPRCFGAASRDTVKPCHNPALRYKVIPTPEDALISPNAPCDPIYESVPYQCVFGADEDKASGTVALLGDSHATHWRGALIRVAAAYRWHGVSMTRSGCPFSTAEPRLPGKLKQECVDWRTQVYQWFTDHPEVRTVFISQHPGNVVNGPGKNERQTKLTGFRDAWKLLPKSVKHIVIIRDTPYVKTGTDDCIDAAMRKHQDAGEACALPRSASVKVDDAADAAVRYHIPGLRMLDMTSFMCDSSRCYPVVGGALTHKDIGHITAVFSDTMGPMLLRKIRAIGIKV
jgi:hypothetical protein